MSRVREGDLLWQPSNKVKREANLTRYMQWLIENRRLRFETYRELWQWSVVHIDDFWQTIWEYFEVKASASPTEILGKRAMPGAEWFVGAELNYVENFYYRMNQSQPAILYKAEGKPVEAIGWSEIWTKVGALAQALREMGVQPGDRVVAYMPHIPETIISLFAAASIGAVWSSCSPDFGSRSVLDRFQQIRPKVLIAVDGYNYGGKSYDRRTVLSELQAGLPTLEKTIVVPQLDQDREMGTLSDLVLWEDLLSSVVPPDQLVFEQLPFDHPLWVLYSSGTTGLPKPIVQGQGGILLEHLKITSLHLDLKPGDRFFWYTSTGWMMWNFLIGGLLTGSTIVVYNGSPGYPDLNVLWELAEETEITYFGTSAAYISACLKAQIEPALRYDLSRIKAVGSTGSPLSASGFDWIYKHINRALALESVSGGTDLCTAFIGGCRLLPIHAGEIQGAVLGANIQSFDPQGIPLVDEVGELVITEPMPSMPVYFWNDPDSERYIASYFVDYPGIWRHGDWIKINQRGGCVIYGRSDSTINRQGVRMGTSEIYQAVESLPEISDSLVIDLEMLGRESLLILFVVLGKGQVVEELLKKQIVAKIRHDISPRHVPNEIIAIEQVPYTLSGKKMEVPIRRILLGELADRAANPGAMRNPESLQFFIDLASSLK